MKARRLPGAVFLGLLGSIGAACQSSGSGSDKASTAPAPPASAGPLSSGNPAAPAASSVDTHGAIIGVPFPAADVMKVVNPNGEPAYSGPTGTLKGTVRIEGDPPPDTGLKIPAKCNDAIATHGKLFRVGLDKTLADVLVAVTGYRGFVPEREPAAKITIHGCALARRTMAVTYGQHVAVSNLDPVDPYMPYLEGAPSKAMLVAVPKGDPVKLYPHVPGHYMLRDNLPNEFLSADVFVVPYPTHDVTGLDGQYEIKGIPVGPVKVSAFLPAIDKTMEKMVEIRAGENTADFTLTFDKRKGFPGAKGASSGSPAAPTSSAKAPRPK